MTREENRALIERAQGGDREAQDVLVGGNMGLCKSLAMKFRDRGVEYEDLCQIAVIGMLKAIKSFDLSYDTAFSTYAVPLIVGEIRRFLRDDGIVKISRSIKKLGSDAMRAREAFTKKHGREPKITELAEICGAEPEELVLSLEAIVPPKSLSEPIGDDGAEIGDILSCEGDEIGKATDKIALSQALQNLSSTSRKLIYLRYFAEKSQLETGKILGMTQVKVSREEKKIIEQLKRTFSE